MEGAGRMTKQEFMAMSFPYELKIINCEVETDFNTITGIMGDAYYISDSKYPYGDIVNCKPILHSLSDLTKEIEHNGEKFVPIVELARIATNSNYEDWRVVDNMAVHSDDLYNFSIAPNCDMMLKKTFGWKDFDICSSQMLLFQKLIEWHFNLMDKSEPFIPVTEEFNPYK